MATVADLRKLALALSGTTEGHHFHQIAFRVADKPFIGIEMGGTHATFSLEKPDIEALLAQAPEVYEALWRSGKHLIGVRVELKKVPARQLQHLIKLSWLKKAPRKLTAESDLQESGRSSK